MIKVFLQFVLFLVAGSSLFGAEYSIVFVHIGKELPTYLPTAVEQARLFNPAAEIVVIGNEEAKRDLPGGARYVTCESLPKTKEHLHFLKGSPLNRSFREAFLLRASERFFYLAEWMAAENRSDVFHVESDNMLYVNLENLLPIFRRHYPGIGLPFSNDQNGVASFVYIPNRQSIERLTHYMALHARSGLTDMGILGKFREELGDFALKALPIIMDEYRSHHPLKSIDGSGHTTKDGALYSSHLADFNSLFDGVAYGLYLGGVDPRNGVSSPGHIDDTCVVNPSYLSFTWMRDDKGRNVPYLSYKQKTYRLNNLHIHCKKLDHFSSRY
jgi:hypothetical protein